MTNRDNKIFSEQRGSLPFSRFLILIFISVTVLIALSLFWNAYLHDQQALYIAREKAIDIFERDVLYRQWSSSNGGVYAPITELNQPNPYLIDVPERDIVTSSGRKLTLINPAYMTRQVHELAKRTDGVKSHITSLKPVRPENAADPWETKVLKEFENGKIDYYSIDLIEGEEHLRFMRPLFITNNCLKCHEKHGYQLGDIRGGISVSILLSPIKKLFAEEFTKVSVWHFMVWVSCLLLILLASKYIKGSELKRYESEIIQTVMINILNASIFSASLEELLQNIHKEICKVLDAENFYVAIYNKQKDRYKFPYYKDTFDQLPSDEYLNLGKGLTVYVQKMNKSIILNIDEINKLVIQQELEIIGTKPQSWLGAPLVNNNESVGVVAVQSYLDPEAYSSKNLELLTYVSGTIAKAIEKKRIDESIHRSLQRKKLHYEQSPLGFIEWDANLRIQSWNPAAEKIFGFTASEMLGKRGIEYLVPDGELKFFNKVKQELLDQKGGSHSSNKNVTKDGIEIFCEWYNTPLINESGETVGIASLCQDISERIKLEEQLLQSQKMESIGQLAGGIAHDFNNILTSILGYSELMIMNSNELSMVNLKSINIIHRSAERAKSLTNQLVGFARKGRCNPVTINLNEEIEEAVKMSEKIFEKNIKITYDFCIGSCQIKADRNQINQIFTNMLINAKDAMPNGGEIVISSSPEYLDEKFIVSHPEMIPGNYIKCSITDTGEGMTKEVQGRIFEPFYTTKDEGKGTGLGLATVYGIVKNHKGHINVYSEPGEGTVFNIYFLIGEGDVIAPKKREDIRFGEGTVLIVDDEEDVREVAKELLEQLGYKILTAKDGFEALEFLSHGEGKIDLVLLDMIMPKLSGKETNQQLQRMDPNIKVILSSGYSRDGQVEEILKEGILGFIQKPFKLIELSNVIADALQKSNSIENRKQFEEESIKL